MPPWVCREYQMSAKRHFSPNTVESKTRVIAQLLAHRLPPLGCGRAFIATSHNNSYICPSTILQQIFSTKRTSEYHIKCGPLLDHLYSGHIEEGRKMQRKEIHEYNGVRIYPVNYFLHA